MLVDLKRLLLLLVFSYNAKSVLITCLKSLFQWTQIQQAHIINTALESKRAFNLTHTHNSKINSFGMFSKRFPDK